MGGLSKSTTMVLHIFSTGDAMSNTNSHLFVNVAKDKKPNPLFPLVLKHNLT